MLPPHMRKYIFTCIVIIISLKVHAAHVVRVGAFNYYPGIFRDSDGTVKGFFTDMLTEIGKRENIRFEYVYGTWSEGMQRLNDGQIDMMPSVAYTPERALIMDYSAQSLLTVWGELYVPQDSEIKGIMDMRGQASGCDERGCECKALH